MCRTTVHCQVICRLKVRLMTCIAYVILIRLLVNCRCLIICKFKLFYYKLTIFSPVLLYLSCINTEVKRKNEVYWLFYLLFFQNILIEVSGTKGGQQILKRGVVADFGLATAIPDPYREFHLSVVGSPFWMAPECIIGQRYNETVFLYLLSNSLDWIISME